MIILRKNVTEFLEELVQILFEKEYFGFESDALSYVSKIYDFIEFELPNFPFRRTPPELIHFGSKYAFYKANNHTTWFIFFEHFHKRYLITHITNNHSEEANFLGVNG